jgi:hypothetical protein
VLIGEIKLFWGEDSSQSHPPASMIIHARLDNGQVQNLATLKPSRGDRVTRVTFNPAKVSELIFLQPPLNGPEINPLMMWLSEIEVY